MAELESSRLGSVERNADAALALSIIAILVQAFMMFFICQHARRGARADRSVDAERGLEFQDSSHGIHQPQDPPLAAPAPTRSRNPVGHSPADALGRPVAAYETQGLHGEADDYYNPSPISRRPTYEVGSGMGAQTHGTDYTKHRRQSRSDGPPTNTNKDADYGRKGNKFAHGT